MLRAQQVQLALTVLTEPLRLFPLEQSLQAPLVQAQPLPIAVVALPQHLISASPVELQVLLVPRAQLVLLVLKVPLVLMEPTGPLVRKVQQVQRELMATTEQQQLLLLGR